MTVDQRTLARRKALVKKFEDQKKKMDVLIDDEELLLMLKKGSDPSRVMVIFSGVGFGDAGVNTQTAEFTKSTFTGDTFYVLDRQRTWGNGLDLERLVDTIHSASEAVDYTTLGVSMGGFLAALTAPLLGAKRAICFAAQWSVSHAVVPDEHRWDAYVKNIAAFKHPTLAESLKHQEVDFHFFYGDAPEEVRHSRHIPDVSNVSLTVLKDCGHDVAWQLREEKKLYPVLSSILEGKAYIDVIEGE